MSNTIDFFKSFKEGIIDNINSALVCKVLSVNGRVATVQPLYVSNGTNDNIIEDAPMLKSVVNDIEVGDLVLVVISKYSIDAAITGRSEEAFSRRFSTNDGIIVGVIG